MTAAVRALRGASSLLRMLMLACACAAILGSARSAVAGDADAALVTDSDGDGESDWLEWLAGTNPFDSASCLAITDLQLKSGQLRVSWRSVGSAVYEVLAATTLDGLQREPVLLGIVRANGGTAPWHETTSSTTNAAPRAPLFICVRRIVPSAFESAYAELSTFE